MNQEIKNIEEQPWIQQAMSALTGKWAQRIILWASLLFLVVLLDRQGNATVTPHTILNGICVLLLYWLMVLINYKYLFPRLLDQKQFLLFIFFLAMIAFVLAPIRLFLTNGIMKLFAPPQNAIRDAQELNMAFFAFVLVGLISTIVKIITDWLVYTRERAELERRNMQSELMYLKSQINPHFLFNTLNSLYALTLRKSDKAPEIVIGLSEIMRYMLYECNERYVKLSKEISYLNNYIKLEQLRHGEHATIIYSQSGELENKMIAPMLMIPFVENAFKHGISNAIDTAYVHINVAVDGDDMEMQVKNSIIPKNLRQKSVKKSGGIGLKNVQRRLDLLYLNKYKLDIDSTENEYIVNLNLNLKII